MCYEVKVSFTLCHHTRYFVIPSGTTTESPGCYMLLYDPDSHMSNLEFTARIRIIDTVNECTEDDCGILGNQIDYLIVLIDALTRRERAGPGAVHQELGFPWGVDRNVAGVEWTTLE